MDLLDFIETISTLSYNMTFSQVSCEQKIKIFDGIYSCLVNPMNSIGTGEF